MSTKTRLVLVIIPVIIGGGFFVQQHFFGPKGNNSPVTSNINSVATHTYTSAKLGAQFTYASHDLGKKILVQESRDKIFVYLEGTRLEDGQFVQVFTKDPNISLQQAVEKEFLQGYKSTDCFLKSGMDVIGTQPASGVATIIAYPISGSANDSWLVNDAKCPKKYSFTNGLSYFWTEKEDDDKFVFFSIGQYYIPSNTVGTSWHTTLKFIK